MCPKTVTFHKQKVLHSRSVAISTAAKRHHTQTKESNKNTIVHKHTVHQVPLSVSTLRVAAFTHARACSLYVFVLS